MAAGEVFECVVEQFLQFEVNEGVYGIDPRFAKIERKKKYWSQDRKSYIIMDVSLELYRRGASEPFWVWIWECKDYTHLVPVDDVEEFHAKLEQIGLHKTKGTIACRNGFQTGAVEYAKSKGIGLVRILPDGSTIRLLEAERAVSKEFIEFGLTQPNTRRLETMFYGLSTSGEGATSLRTLLGFEIRESELP